MGQPGAPKNQGSGKLQKAGRGGWPATHKCFHLALLEAGGGDSSPVSGAGWDKQQILCQPWVFSSRHIKEGSFELLETMSVFVQDFRGWGGRARWEEDSEGPAWSLVKERVFATSIRASEKLDKQQIIKVSWNYLEADVTEQTANLKSRKIEGWREKQDLGIFLLGRHHQGHISPGEGSARHF